MQIQNSQGDGEAPCWEKEQKWGQPGQCSRTERSGGPEPWVCGAWAQEQLDHTAEDTSSL